MHWVGGGTGVFPRPVVPCAGAGTCGMSVEVWDLGTAVGWKRRPVLVFLGPVTVPGSLGRVKCVPAPVTFCLCPWLECLG